MEHLTLCSWTWFLRNETRETLSSKKKIEWCQQINTAAIVNKLPNLCLVCLPLTRNVSIALGPTRSMSGLGHSPTRTKLGSPRSPIVKSRRLRRCLYACSLVSSDFWFILWPFWWWELIRYLLDWSRTTVGV
jgi:hypothetical protein